MLANQLKAKDGTLLYTYQWLPTENLRALIVVVHGMAEHGARYERLALYLNNSGIGLITYDQRGHGRTLSEKDTPGDIGNAGWKKIIGDARLIFDSTANHFSEVPVFLMGHSMGAIVALSCMQRFTLPVRGWIRSSPPLYEGFLTEIGWIYSEIQTSLAGKASAGVLQTKLSFDVWNSKYKPNRTAFDWISRDEHEVDKYVNDPMCGFTCSAGLWLQLIKGLKSTVMRKNLKRIPANVPLYMFAGSEDPVVGAKKGFRKQEAVLAAYVENLHTRVYEGGRHEMLNESNRDEVFKDLLSWLEENV